MIRNLFSGNRHAAPLGAAKDAVTPEQSKLETLQSVRSRQRKKHQSYLAQIVRAEQEYEEVAVTSDKSTVAKQKVEQLSHSADILSGQIMVIERILEEFGLMNEIEEERKKEGEQLEEMRRRYEQGAMEADDARRESVARVEEGNYMSALGSSFMMPSEVLDVVDEDEAMRDLDETAKLTGRT